MVGVRAVLEAGSRALLARRRAVRAAAASSAVGAVALGTAVLGRSPRPAALLPEVPEEPSRPDEVTALRALHAVVQRVHASLDLPATLDAVARGVLDATCFGVVVINLRLPSGDFEVVSVEGDPSAREALLGLVEPAAQWAQLLDRSQHWGRLRFVHHDDATADGDTMLSWVPDVAVSEDPDAWHPSDALFAPLVAPSGMLVGALSVDLPAGGRRPTSAQCEVLEIFAEHAAIAIEHARVTAALQASRDDMAHAAHHDPLTGLANRALLMTHGAAVAAAESGSLGVLVLDLDRFKAVNDASGHHAGDQVLRVLAGRMRACVREGDLLARAGGDEFVVVVALPHGDAGAVTARLAAQLRQACDEPVAWRSQRYSVGVSIGVAVAAVPVPFEVVLARADAAMFAEKRAARSAVG